MARRAKRAKTTVGVSKRRGGGAALTNKKTPRRPSSKRCYLLEMPPEVRNRICELVLYQPEGVEVDLTDPTLNERCHTLARTNRQLREECGKRFFNVNTFVFRLHKSDFPEDPEWMWVAEREGFNDFIEQHVISLRSIHIQYGEEGKNDGNAKYFGDNLSPIQISLKKLRASNVPSQFSTAFQCGHYTVPFDISLIDRDIAEAEIEKQIRARFVEIGLDPENEIKAMQLLLGDALYGRRREGA